MKLTIAERLKNLFSLKKINEELLEELEDILIEGDVGALVAEEVITALKAECCKQKSTNDREFINALKRLLGDYLCVDVLEPEKGRLNVYVILGVNGVGKTTTLAKLAEYFRCSLGDGILLAAGDTFRAAAIDQLVLWGERLNLPVVRQSPGADPGAVIFDAISSAKAKNKKLVLADTAGRMHTKTNLIKELGKIDKIVRNNNPGGSYKKILVIDATTGQNALQQAAIFHEAIGVDSVILAKYDSTARGGIVIAICKNLGIPFSFIGMGETLKDIHPFDSEQYLQGLISGS